MKRQLLKNEKYRIFFATFCALGWSLAYPLIKLGYQSFGIVSNDLGSKFLFAGLRFLFAGIALLLTSNRLKKSWHIQDRGKLLLFALVNITFHYMFAYIGLGFNPGSRSTILDSLSGFLLIVMAGWVDHNDSFSKQKLVGILLGITGILFINLSPNQNYFENIEDSNVIICSSIKTNHDLKYYITSFTDSYTCLDEIDGAIQENKYQQIENNHLMLEMSEQLTMDKLKKIVKK